MGSWVAFLIEVASTDPAIAETQQFEPRVEREHELFAFALYEITARLKEHAPELLTNELHDRLGSFTASLRRRSLEGSSVWEARRAGYLLVELLEQHTRPVPLQLFDRWCASDDMGPANREDHQKLRWSLIADVLLERPASALEGHGLEDRLLESWNEILPNQTWWTLEKHYCANPHHAEPLVRFLLTCLLHLPGAKELASQRLLKLLAFAPSFLERLAPALTPALWGPLWPDLIDRILASAGGEYARARSSFHDDAGAATEHQLGAIDLWTAHARHVGRSAAHDDESMKILTDALRSAALLALGDERALVANHAAYAIVSAAESADDAAEVQIFARVLRRMARDTRVLVRMAAAYAGGRLSVRARSSVIREAAAAIGRELADDPNAMIAGQRTLGHLEAERENKRVQDSPDTRGAQA
jgi:hypothetical protein